MLLESFTHSILLGAGGYLAGWLLENFGTAAGLGALITLTGLNLTILVWLGREQVPQTNPVADSGCLAVDRRRHRLCAQQPPDTGCRARFRSH